MFLPPRAPSVLLLLSLSLVAACAPEPPAENAPAPHSDSGRDGAPGRAAPGVFAALPSVAVRGSAVALKVSALTEFGTPAEPPPFSALSLSSTDPALAAFGEFARVAASSFRRDVAFGTLGFHTITVRADDGTSFTAGPVRVVATEEELIARAGESPERIYWGDARAQSDFGVGTQPPAYLLRYAKHSAHLDWVALTDPDLHPFLSVGLDSVAGAWDSTRAGADEWRSSDFAILAGWEWSSPEHGHRVVLLPDFATNYVSFQRADSPATLAHALRSTPAFAVLVSPQGSRFAPPVRWDGVVPGFDRAIEVYSGHGASDGGAYRPPPGLRREGVVRASLRRDLPLGFVAVSASRLGTPGTPWRPALPDAPWPGGLTAVSAPAGDARSIHAALRAGRTYATTGARFVVEFRVEDATFGGTVLPAPGTSAVRVRAQVAAVEPMHFLELWLDHEREARHETDQTVVEWETTLDLGAEPTAVWLTGESRTGERFWTTPVRVISR